MQYKTYDWTLSRPVAYLEYEIVQQQPLPLVISFVLTDSFTNHEKLEEEMTV